MILTHPSYENIDFALNHIMDYLDEVNFQPDLIVGLARGGTYPALILSQTMNVPFQLLYYSSKKGKGNDKNHNNKFIDFDLDNRILIVDEIVDGGHTFAEVNAYYEPKYEIKTASIYCKENSIFKPDVHWWTLPTTSPFVHFPWEKSIRLNRH